MEYKWQRQWFKTCSDPTSTPELFPHKRGGFFLLPSPNKLNVCIGFSYIQNCPCVGLQSFTIVEVASRVWLTTFWKGFLSGKTYFLVWHDALRTYRIQLSVNHLDSLFPIAIYATNQKRLIISWPCACLQQMSTSNEDNYVMTKVKFLSKP